ncbi:DUF4097 family beta strand repeat-containing protein [Levilactobacillus sp. HBUAS70063]|uniref:DUF4097 family beta strand repeat-containing protein n=1 Tax=Levilactobacillus sp. HBUAS70063 TaxID=3109359 RepID=UPI003132A7E1
MKRSVKIGLTLMILGAILLGIGWMNHGDKSVVWDKQTRSFRTIHQLKRSYRPADYQRIVVASKAPVTIKAGNTSRVTVSYIDGYRGLPRTRVSKGALIIEGGRPADRLDISIFGISDHATTNGGVLVTVPRDKQLTNLEVKPGSGHISLRSLHARQMTLKNSDDLSLMDLRVKRAVTIRATDGDIWADQIRAHKLDINTDDGDIGISNSQLAATDNQFVTADGDIRVSNSQLGGGRASSGDGDVNIEENHLERTFKATTDDGDIHAYIGRTAGARVSAQDADTGDITVQGENRKSGYWLRRTAKAQYQLRTNDGSIRVANRP